MGVVNEVSVQLPDEPVKLVQIDIAPFADNVQVHVDGELMHEVSGNLDVTLNYHGSTQDRWLTRPRTVERIVPSDCSKLCWWCAYFIYRGATRDYSDVTPGDQLNIECRKRVWYFDAFKTGEKEFRAIISMASKCPHFKHEERVIEEGI